MEILRVTVRLVTQDGGRGSWGRQVGKRVRGLGYPSPTVMCAVQGSVSPCPSIDPTSPCSSLGKGIPPFWIKAHLGFQLVQGSPILIRVKQGAVISRGGQEGVTWTMLRTHLDVMVSVTMWPSGGWKPWRVGLLSAHALVMVIPRKMPAPSRPSYFFEE